MELNILLLSRSNELINFFYFSNYSLLSAEPPGSVLFCWAHQNMERRLEASLVLILLNHHSGHKLLSIPDIWRPETRAHSRPIDMCVFHHRPGLEVKNWRILSPSDKVEFTFSNRSLACHVKGNWVGEGGRQEASLGPGPFHRNRHRHWYEGGKRVRVEGDHEAGSTWSLRVESSGSNEEWGKGKKKGFAPGWWPERLKEVFLPPGWSMLRGAGNSPF